MRAVAAINSITKRSLYSPIAGCTLLLKISNQHEIPDRFSERSVRSLHTGTDRDRAQMDPRVADLLVVALGLVLTGVITVGAIVP